MAYSSVRVQFEIGHEASVRTKKTPEGFTHDWEVFVRGADNTDIQYFVDKVVFHLHETFPKPKRVIKEPPYSVKESGYAGFVLPIDVYLKNKEEPKKISFQYDLNLQSSGPPISRVLREPRLFQNPSEDFRRKLIRGGGVGVDTPSEIPTEDVKSGSSMSQSKSKLTESSIKKHKPDQALNHSFAELFGPPIRRVPDTKKLPEPAKKSSDDSPKDKKKLSKHGPYKEEKDAPREKDKYLEKDRNKERDKSKEKPSKMLPSPCAVQMKPKEEYKKHEEKEKKKEEHDEKKKRKEDKDKKEKPKDAKELDRQFEKDHKKEKRDSKDGDYLKKLNSNKIHDAKTNFEKHNSDGIEKEKERIDKEKHKHRHKKKEKEKNRDKERHRKEKEKSDKDPREREREKEKSNKKRHEEMREKEEKRRTSASPSLGSLVHERLKKGPLNALLDELGSSDSASPLSEEEAISPVKPHPKAPGKLVPEIKTQPTVNATPKFKSTNSNASLESRHEKEGEKTLKPDESNAIRNKKEKSSSKRSKKLEKDAEKKRAKEETRARSVSSELDKEEEGEKERASREERDRLEKERPEEEKPKSKDKENRKRKREKSEEKHAKGKKENSVAASQSTGAAELSDGAEEIRRSDKFTKEYVAQLKDLQHRIMTLEDNAELQKVVKVIAETGQYEITKKTFDFDLCALDFDTVKRLQEFFAPT